MFKFNKPVHLDQLPKLKYKQSKADKLEQSQTKETLEDTYQKDDTSTVMISISLDRFGFDSAYCAEE